MFKRQAVVGAVAALVLLVGASPVGAGSSGTGDTKRYLVVFAGDYAVDSTYAVGGGYAVLCNYAVLNGYAVACDYAVAHDYAVSLVETAGGTVTSDMLSQIGVLVVESTSALFTDVMRSYAVVQEVGQDFAASQVPGGGPQQTNDPAEAVQWNMQMIRAPEAHGAQAGARSVEVGILDTGIDGTHVDFVGSDGSNVDCEKGRDSIAHVFEGGPGVGVPAAPCVDHFSHGTHVAGIVGARANGLGVVGVAPNVTLVPVKVCDSIGHCYASAVVDGITYSGDMEFEVINMSFFVDDDETLESTELKCMDDPEQRAFRHAVRRAIQYARSQGVAPVAALGNSDTDLGEQGRCEVMPVEAAGVIGVPALGPESEKAGYSSYGEGAADAAAPGGNAPITGASCDDQVLSTIPGGYACLQGTSMASPHAAGVAALIVSELGTLGSDGDVEMSPTSVESTLQGTTVDIGLAGYDECFGHGRIDALRAVQKDTSKAYDGAAPFCPEYGE